jgi:RNA polymerase sigma-70 factor, ECF subfamily
MPASYHPAPTPSGSASAALRLSDPLEGGGGLELTDALELTDPNDPVWAEKSAVFELPGARPSLPPELMDSLPPPTASDPGALEDIGQLFSNYRAYVAKIGRRILGSSSEVDDLIQDVFLATVRDAHKIKDPARLGAWLGTVTTRMAKRRRYRSTSHPVANDDLDDIADVTDDGRPGPESTADLSGNVRRLLSLPDELRTPWLLKHVEGHTLEDVARQCDCSMSTAARRIQTVSDKLSRRR